MKTAFSSRLDIVSFIQVKPPFSFVSRAPFMKAASASRDRAPPTLRRLTPTAFIYAAESEGSAALITTLSGLPTEEATSFMVARSRKSRRVEHVGSRLLEGLQAPDRVVEVGPAADQVLGPRDEGEGYRQRARHLDTGDDAFTAWLKS